MAADNEPGPARMQAGDGEVPGEVSALVPAPTAGDAIIDEAMTIFEAALIGAVADGAAA